MDIRLMLHDPNGGALIPVSGTWEIATGIVLNRAENSRVSIAHMLLQNTQGGEPIKVIVNIHDDGTIELGNAIPPAPAQARLYFETPNQDNSLHVLATIASGGAVTLTGVTITGSGAPTFDAAEIGLVLNTNVVVRFSEKVVSSDFNLGVTILKNGVAEVGVVATRQANHAVVYYTLGAPVDSDDVLTWEYNAAVGDIADETDGTVMATLAAQPVTNNVAPVLASSEIGTVDATTLVATFDSDIESPGADYTLGVTIQVAGVGNPIISGTRQADHKEVRYVVTNAVLNGQAVTIAYSSAVGDIRGEVNHKDLVTFAATPVTNNVP